MLNTNQIRENKAISTSKSSSYDLRFDFAPNTGAFKSEYRYKLIASVSVEIWYCDVRSCPMRASGTATFSVNVKYVIYWRKEKKISLQLSMLEEFSHKNNIFFVQQICSETGIHVKTKFCFYFFVQLLLVYSIAK